MSDVPTELKYTASHEWVRQEDDGSVTIGITDHAQELLGDMVYVEPPELGPQIKKGEECSVVESAKAASDIYSPLSGEIIAVNEALEPQPEMINQSPYNEGWIFQIKPSDIKEYNELLDMHAYQELADSSEA